MFIIFSSFSIKINLLIVKSIKVSRYLSSCLQESWASFKQRNRHCCGKGKRDKVRVRRCSDSDHHHARIQPVCSGSAWKLFHSVLQDEVGVREGRRQGEDRSEGRNHRYHQRTDPASFRGMEKRWSSESREVAQIINRRYLGWLNWYISIFYVSL